MSVQTIDTSLPAGFEELEPWVNDWRGRVHGAAAAMLAPSSTDEVVEIVRLAAEHGRLFISQELHRHDRNIAPTSW